MKYNIVENSPFARIARMVLKSPNVAMVLGKSIHLSGVDRETFLQNKQWVTHEECHIRQFQEHGYFRFLWLYFIESCRKGYYQNRFEVEARVAAGQEGSRHLKNMAKQETKPKSPHPNPETKTPPEQPA